MPIEIEVHRVLHFKAPVNGKEEFWGLECAGTFRWQNSIVKLGYLVHKVGSVAFHSGTTVANQAPIAPLSNSGQTLCADTLTVIYYSTFLEISNLVLFGFWKKKSRAALRSQWKD